MHADWFAGQWAAYPHLNDAVLINMNSIVDGAVPCSVMFCKSTVMSVKFCLSGGAPVLVVGTFEGVQVWEPTEGIRLASISLPASGTVPPDRHSYAIGFCIVPRENGSSVLIAGSASGSLHIIEADKYRFVYSEGLASNHRDCIADISSTHEPEYAEHTLAPSCLFAVADESGIITVWDAAQLVVIAELKAPGESITSVRIRGERILAGTAYGKLLLFSLSSAAGASPACELCGHARGVLGVALHPASETVATVGEDGGVNVWSIEAAEAREVEAEVSRCVKDALLCGVAFVGPAHRDMALISYDSDVLTILAAESSAQ